MCCLSAGHPKVDRDVHSHQIVIPRAPWYILLRFGMYHAVLTFVRSFVSCVYIVTERLQILRPDIVFLQVEPQDASLWGLQGTDCTSRGRHRAKMYSVTRVNMLWLRLDAPARKEMVKAFETCVIAHSQMLHQVGGKHELPLLLR